MSDNSKEKRLKFYPSPITLAKSSAIIEQMKTAICKITTKNGKGVGFFCSIPYRNSALPVLITPNHIINEPILKENRALNITVNEGRGAKKIKLFRNKKIFIDTSNEITIIEIIPEIDKIYNFLELDEDVCSREKNNLNESVYIPSYSKTISDHEISVTYGVLNQIEEDKIKLFCNMGEGLPGAPILNTSRNKVIGIFQEGDIFNLDKKYLFKNSLLECLNDSNLIQFENEYNIDSANELKELDTAEIKLGPEIGETEEEMKENKQENVKPMVELEKTRIGPENEDEEESCEVTYSKSIKQDNIVVSKDNVDKAISDSKSDNMNQIRQMNISSNNMIVKNNAYKHNSNDNNYQNNNILSNNNNMNNNNKENDNNKMNAAYICNNDIYSSQGLKNNINFPNKNVNNVNNFNNFSPSNNNINNNNFNLVTPNGNNNSNFINNNFMNNSQNNNSPNNNFTNNNQFNNNININNISNNNLSNQFNNNAMKNNLYNNNISSNNNFNNNEIINNNISNKYPPNAISNNNSLNSNSANNKSNYNNNPIFENNNYLNSNSDKREEYKNKNFFSDFEENLNINEEMNNQLRKTGNFQKENASKKMIRSSSDFLFDQNKRENNISNNIEKQNQLVNSFNNINIKNINQNSQNNQNMNSNAIKSNINILNVNSNINDKMNFNKDLNMQKNDRFNSLQKPNSMVLTSNNQIDRSKIPSTTGFKDSGSSSYLNSVLHLLSSLQDFITFFLNSYNEKLFAKDMNKTKLSFLICRIFLHLYPGKKSEREIYEPKHQLEYFNGNKIKKNPCDLFSFILRQLHQELKSFNKTDIQSFKPGALDINMMIEMFKRENNSLILNLFNFFEIKDSQCSRCNNKTNECFNFNILNVDLLQSCNDLKNKYSYLTIYNYLENRKAMKQEYKLCEKCGLEQWHVFSKNIFELPKILVISLNRGEMEQNLLNIPFCIEKNINLSNFAKNGKQYELIGIVSIYMSKKKYICCCRSPVDLNWYYYEGENVNKYPLDTIIINHNNYNYVPCILVYQAMNMNN